MEFCSLGSGSGGNAHLVRHGQTTLLVECGFSQSKLRARLAGRGVHPADLAAALVSHEHGDHTRGLAFAAAANIPLYMSAGTAQNAPAAAAPPRRETLRARRAFVIGDISILPVPVPHEAAEPLQFVFTAGDENGGAEKKLALFTDLGHITAAVADACKGATMLVVECNYDEEMLAANDKYPESVKQRIAGKFGHLSNGAAAELVRLTAEQAGGKLKNIVAAHISENNNTPKLALAAIAAAAAAADATGATVTAATQADGTDWLEV